MSSENTTIQLQNKATWYVRFQRKAGRILGVSPQLINKVNDDEEVAVIDNELCKDLVSGKKNLRKCDEIVFLTYFLFEVEAKMLSII